MGDKLKVIIDLKDLSAENIDRFNSVFANSIRSLVLKNNGNEEQFKKVLIDVISELYFRVRNFISFENYDPEILVYTLAYLVFKKSFSIKGKDRIPIILDQDYYETRALKILSLPYIKDEIKCDSIIKNMGEPGRTILRLSFFENQSDEQITNHVRFESSEQLKMRRTKLVDRCIESS